MDAASVMCHLQEEEKEEEVITEGVESMYCPILFAFLVCSPYCLVCCKYCNECSKHCHVCCQQCNMFCKYSLLCCRYCLLCCQYYHSWSMKAYCDRNK